MFRHEGPSRSPRKNAQLAGCLAFVAGYVNSGGFVLIGSFTSHVTGNLGRLGNDVALGNPTAALFAGFMVVAFFVGGFVSSLVLESLARVNVPRAYGIALALEGTLLLAFIFIAGLGRATLPRVLDAEGAVLSAAMGVQNALVTRLSGAVVRTTHLTGVVTDLSIEIARWYRWRTVGVEDGPPSKRDVARSALGKITLLAIIVTAFVSGSVLGALLTFRISRWAMFAPAGGVFLASAYAFYPRRSQQD
ncbi:MAG TPA: YoaK family protein [Polyangiaceae bacterium]|nr:YoaK family protein [Polyangiaceae bacterium]